LPKNKNYVFFQHYIVKWILKKNLSSVNKNLNSNIMKTLVVIHSKPFNLPSDKIFNLFCFILYTSNSFNAFYNNKIDVFYRYVFV